MQYGSEAPNFDQPKATPMGQEVVGTFTYNLDRMHKLVNVLEDKCHNILNLRTPTPPQGKAETTMENDLASALSNRFNDFDNLNDRLENIALHLEKIIG